MNDIKGEFYLLELYRVIGQFSGKKIILYKRHDGVTPNVTLAKKYKTLDKALKDKPKRKYPSSKVMKYTDGNVEEVRL